MTDRTSMDDLAEAAAAAAWSRTHDLTPWSSISDISLGGDYRADARYALDAVQALLRERGLLLGPDGLLRAERVGIYRVIEWSRDGLPLDSTVQWIEECDMLADDDLFTLSRLDPPEDTPWTGSQC